MRIILVKHWLLYLWKLLHFNFTACTSSSFTLLLFFTSFFHSLYCAYVLLLRLVFAVCDASISVSYACYSDDHSLNVSSFFVWFLMPFLGSFASFFTISLWFLWIFLHSILQEAHNSADPFHCLFIYVCAFFCVVSLEKLLVTSIIVSLTIYLISLCVFVLRRFDIFSDSKALARTHQKDKKVFVETHPYSCIPFISHKAQTKKLMCLDESLRLLHHTLDAPKRLTANSDQVSQNPLHIIHMWNESGW